MKQTQNTALDAVNIWPQRTGPTQTAASMQSKADEGKREFDRVW